jgi:fluoroacetyl-CoA thioesterase
LGRTAEATLRMFPADTADATLCLPGLHVPGSPASSRVAEVMELACARLMRSRLQDGESTVAVSTSLHHAALSQARGETIRARATCERVEGRLYYFMVHVFDESGLIASGEHVRAVVSARRVEAIARRRHALPSMLLKV